MNFSRVNSGDHIDGKAIKNLQTINPEIDIRSKIETNSTIVGMLIENAHNQVQQNNFSNLESICYELSHATLTIGASQLLKASFELQVFARQKNYKDSIKLITKMKNSHNDFKANLGNILEC